MPPLGASAEAIDKNNTLTEDLSQTFQSYAYWVSIKTFQFLPMTLGVLLQTMIESTIDQKKHRFTYKLTSKFMTAFNTALATPVISPMISILEKQIFKLTKKPSEENTKSSQQELPSYFDDMSTLSNQKYTKHERVSRDTIHTVSTFTSMAFQNTRNALDFNEYQMAAKYIAELAIRLRLLFEEIAPTDPFLMRIAKIYFSDLPNFNNLEFKTLCVSLIASLDKEWEKAEVQAYYEEALSSWFDN